MKFPDVPPFDKVPGLKYFFTTMFKSIGTEMDKTVKRDTAVGHIILAAPNGSTWEVKVNNAGAISTTQLSG